MLERLLIEGVKAPDLSDGFTLSGYCIFGRLADSSLSHMLSVAQTSCQEQF